MEQSVQPAQIDEGSEVRDVLHHALPDLAQQELLHQGGPLLLPLTLQDHPPRNDDVSPPFVELDDLEVVALAQEVFDVGDPSEGDLRAGEEGVHPHEVHRHAPLDLADQGSLHGAVSLVGLLDLLPDPEEIGLLLGENDDAFFVLQALQEDFDGLARLDGLRILELLLGTANLRS